MHCHASTIHQLAPLLRNCQHLGTSVAHHSKGKRVQHLSIHQKCYGATGWVQLAHMTVPCHVKHNDIGIEGLYLTVCVGTAATRPLIARRKAAHIECSKVDTC